MRRIRTEGVIPLSLKQVWRLLHAHLDEDRIREIHPWMLSGRTVREGDAVGFDDLRFPREKVSERLVKVAGRPTRTTWSYRIEPPVRYAYETVFANGSVTRFDNAYALAEGGTLVTTVGEVSIKRVPGSLATWFVNRSLKRADDEDLAYARKKGL